MSIFIKIAYVFIYYFIYLFYYLLNIYLLFIL